MPVYQTGMGGVHGKRPPPSQISRKISLFVYLVRLFSVRLNWVMYTPEIKYIV